MAAAGNHFSESSMLLAEHVTSSADQCEADADLNVTTSTVIPDDTDQSAAVEGDAQLSLSTADDQPSSSASNRKDVTQESVRPYPKAESQKRGCMDYRRRHDRKVLTDTPVKRQLEIEAEDRVATRPGLSGTSRIGAPLSRVPDTPAPGR